MDLDPIASVVAQLARRLETVPFVPFDICMSDGKRYHVPTADHITITRLLRRVELETDEPRIVEINPLHVVALDRAA